MAEEVSPHWTAFHARREASALSGRAHPVQRVPRYPTNNKQELFPILPLYRVSVYAVGLVTAAWPCAGVLLGRMLSVARAHRALVLLLFASGSGSRVGQQFARPPVFLVPGSLHSKLYLQATGADGCPAAVTDANRTAETLYLNWTSLRPPRQACWIRRMSQKFDPTTSTYHAPPGVSVFADVTTFNASEIPSVDPWTFPNASSYEALLAALRTVGYRDGQNLLVAPYDWRQAPDQLDRYFERLRSGIEEVRLFTGRKVVLLGHSAGPSVILFFLARQPLWWKQRNVRSMVSLNGNLAGEIDCLENLWEGGDFLNPAAGVTVWDRVAYRRAQWTWGITAWCLPSPAIYGDQHLVQIRNQSYSARTLPALFRAIGPEAAGTLGLIWPTVANLTDASTPPGVPTFCIAGTGVPTPVHYSFADGNLSNVPDVVFGSGDGQQDDRTNMACAGWPNSTTRTFLGANHDGLLSDPKLLAYLTDVVLVKE